MKIKLTVFILLLGVIGHDSYGMIRSFCPEQVKPLIGNYSDPYRFGSRRISLSISPDFIPESILSALHGKDIERRNVFFIVYDLSGLTSPYNMVMHPALQAWTEQKIIKRNIDMSFFDTEGILPDRRNSVPFNGLKKVNVNIHNGKGLAYSPNNARFKKGPGRLGVGWFVALSPDNRSASISYLLLIYNNMLADQIGDVLHGKDTIDKNIIDNLELIKFGLGPGDQNIFDSALENVRRFFIPGYEPVPIKKPKLKPTAYEELIIEKEDIVIVRMIELHDALLNLLHELESAEGIE